MSSLPPPPRPPLSADPQAVARWMDEHHRWQLQLYESLGKAREPSGDRLDRLETDVLALKARPHSVSDFVGLSDTPNSITNGDLYYGSSNALVALGIGTNGQYLKVASNLPSWAAGTGGLVLEATDTADGTAEFLQASMTSTPSSIKRAEFHFRGLTPEIDGDNLFITHILDDDSELTAAQYRWEGWFKTAAVALAGSSNSSQNNIALAGSLGNVSGETTDIFIRLMSPNGSETNKHFEIFISKDHSASGYQAVGCAYRVESIGSNQIKGIRIDTDNAGDMINSGTLQVWVQT